MRITIRKREKTGDLNVVHQEIDLKNPKTNQILFHYLWKTGFWIQKFIQISWDRITALWSLI